MATVAATDNYETGSTIRFMMHVVPSILFAPLLLAGLLLPEPTRAHGSVAAEDDLCLIEIGYYKAHFKVYLPGRRQHEQFCEDLPSAGESIFIMEYVHTGLSDVPIDFRIIRNVTGQGRFTRLSDVEQIEDLEAVTVFHHPARAQADVFSVRHTFAERGKFVGIVTLEQPGTGKVHTAVFPFDVGFTGFGYWPLFALVAVALQLNYLWMSGWFSKWRRKRRPQFTVIPGSRRG